MGQKLISRIFQFYTSDRVLSYQSPSKEWMAYTFERQKLMQDDNGNAVDPTKRAQMFKNFKFMITPESSLAMTRIQRSLSMIQMRSATGFVPSIKRILAESDIGDPDQLMEEGMNELKNIPQAPPPKGRSGKK